MTLEVKSATIAFSSSQSECVSESELANPCHSSSSRECVCVWQPHDSWQHCAAATAAAGETLRLDAQGRPPHKFSPDSGALGHAQTRHEDPPAASASTQSVARRHRKGDKFAHLMKMNQGEKTQQQELDPEKS